MVVGLHLAAKYELLIKMVGYWSIVFVVVVYIRKVVVLPKIIVNLYVPANICPQYSPLCKESETISVLLSRREVRAEIKIKVLFIKTNFSGNNQRLK